MFLLADWHISKQITGRFTRFKKRRHCGKKQVETSKSLFETVFYNAELGCQVFVI